MASYDRTSNIPHLKGTFPELAGMSSEEVQAFLNEKSGLAVSSDTPNGVAFDRWRQALARQGTRICGSTPTPTARGSMR